MLGMKPGDRIHFNFPQCPLCEQSVHSIEIHQREKCPVAVSAALNSWLDKEWLELDLTQWQP